MFSIAAASPCQAHPAAQHRLTSRTTGTPSHPWQEGNEIREDNTRIESHGHDDDRPDIPMQPTPSDAEPALPDWGPHLELLHGIQHLRQELGTDFSVMASELRIMDPTPEGIARQLAAIRERTEPQGEGRS